MAGSMLWLVASIFMLCFANVFANGAARQHPMGRERLVGRHLHPSFARARSLASAASASAPGSWISVAKSGTAAKQTTAAVPTALVLPLFPVELGAYVTTLTLGSPGQLVTGLVDTGSGIVHFPCAECSGDGCDATLYPDLESYNISASTTATTANCSDWLAPFLVYGTTGGSVNAMNCTWFENQDSDGQVAGSLAYAGGNSANFVFFHDEIVMGLAPTPETLAPFEPLVACDFEASASSFGAGFSGIFGMNFQPGSLYSQVVSSYGFAPTLTICLGDGQGGPNQVLSSHSGLLAIGAVTPKPALAKSWTTPLAFTAGSGWYNAQSFHSVAVTGLYLGNVAILNPVAGATPLYNFFFDSGTTVLDYPPALLTPFRALLLAALRGNSLVASVTDLVETQARLVVTYKNASRVLSNAEKDTLFPTIYFVFAGTGKVPFRPSSYLISAGSPLVTDPSVLTPGHEFIFMGNAAQSIGAMYTGVLGNAFMNRMLIQVQQDVANGGGNVTMSIVDTCSSVTLVAV